MKYYSAQNGFSLVETLVSIAILLIIIIGPMTISSSAARSTSFSSEQVIAYFLAQEGAEFVQKARDDELLNHFDTFPNGPQTAWANFTNDYADCFSSNGCNLEIQRDADGTLETPADCSTIADCRLYYRDYNNNNFPNNKRNLYTYLEQGGDVESPFTRVITLVHDGNEVHVTSKVTWRTGSQRNNQEAVVETYLFNVYGN